jgi:hypothetical protein
VKHNSGFLGAVASFEEAEALANDLCTWIVSTGCEAQVVAAAEPRKPARKR